MLPPKSNKRIFNLVVLAFILLVADVFSAAADNALALPSFSQDWSDNSLITSNDDWSGVPSIMGYRGDNLTTLIGTDPQTILGGDDSSPVVNVLANQTNPNIINGGVAEFHLADSVVALQGSGTADAPYIKIFLNTTNMNNVRIVYVVRDIDASADNAVQAVALHYRIGSSGSFTNIPAAYIADATTGPSIATMVTPVDVTLPAVVNNQPHVELRIMTSNASGNDEWVGIDNISITANSTPTGHTLSSNSIPENQPIGTVIGTLTAQDIDVGDTHTFAFSNSASCSDNGSDNVNFSLTGNTLTSAVVFDHEVKASYLICVTVTDNNGLSFTGEQTVNILNIADETPPQVLFSSNMAPANNSVLLTGPSQITIEFNEDVKNDSSAGAANLTANYLLVSTGSNGAFDTINCEGGLVADDTPISIDAASYANNGGSGPFIATLTINNTTPLPSGIYRLFVCGTTSIEDLAGNELNNGASDTQITFTVTNLLTSSSSSDPRSKTLLPQTGFPTGRITNLPNQPLDKTYASFSDLRLEIPSLALSTPIVGVPLTADGWDVTWLGKDAGWLNGTAFPGWAGNSILTAHVWDAYNQPGPFHKLKALKYGDYIKVHAFGQIYIYEVRQSKRIMPDNFTAALKHEEKAWLTLLTCEDYRTLFQTYTYRRMVRAVLVSVVDE
ncbi:MAG: hypothetical protein Fur0017_30420 [Anaerolineales bacterium]